MQSSFPSYLISILFSLLVISCDKERETTGSPNPRPSDTIVASGKFDATMNNTKWSPIKYEAVYYPKWHQLYILANDSIYLLKTGISLDSNTMFKSYILETNGDNAAVIRRDTLIKLPNGGGARVFFYYGSDQNLPDVGGSFQLTRLDTIAKKLSGNLQFVSYGQDRKEKISFTSLMTDISLRIDTSSYDGSISKCTVIGVKSTEWQSKNISTGFQCSSHESGSGTLFRVILVYISSISGMGSEQRYINLQIPVFPTNTLPFHYTVKPDDNSLSCHSKYIESIYFSYDTSKIYIPYYGDFEITSLDPINRKLQAKFHIIYKDPVTQEVIELKNGSLTLNNWEQ